MVDHLQASRQPAVWSEQVDVAVVGAGGGGAVLGLALARKGVRVLVLEQASGPPGGLRGEILQPNGQRILDQFGLLTTLPANATCAVRRFHFCRPGGERLCTIDYGTLPPPYNKAIVTLPNVAHHAILDALALQAPGVLRYEMEFTGLVREQGSVVGLIATHRGQEVRIAARIVVGADGAFSRVRDALGISVQVHRYTEGYLIALMDSPEPVTEARYFAGRRTILGLFPAAEKKLYAFYMVPAGSMEALKAEGLERLKARWLTIDPDLEKPLAHLVDWRQTAYLPTGRVRASRWVADGSALIGDAAHAMNPHVSQGRMQAMEDAVVLAEVVRAGLERGDCSAASLGEYERRRRPHVEMLQGLADEQVLFWNTGNPVLGFLRDRVFRTLGRNARLRSQVLAVTAGLRETPPFSLLDRVIAAGFFPDLWAKAPEG